MSEEKQKGLSSDKLHAIQDVQGKIYFAEKTPFGWLTVEGIPFPSYGMKDLGLALIAYQKLAQYRHAARVLTVRLSNDFNNFVALVKEVDND